MKRIVPLILILLFVPAVQAAQFSPWNNWTFSNANYVRIEGGNLLVNFSNDSLQMASTVHGMEKGDKISIHLQYTVSELAVIAGFRVIVNGEELENRELISSGSAYINITAPEDMKSVDIVIVLYVVQGTFTATVFPGEIISPPKGLDSGLLISGVGITVVFIVLGLLSAIMYGFGVIERGEEEVEKEEVKEMESMKQEGIPPEDLVAITAAIQEYMKGKRFRIISVKPSPWKHYGRLVNMRRWK